MGGDFGFWDLSIQCAARHMDISAFVPLQDLGFGRRAARLAGRPPSQFADGFPLYVQTGNA
jgi:hypothetical protein